jgi:DNA transposition AAA+ family ATPase
MTAESSSVAPTPPPLGAAVVSTRAFERVQESGQHVLAQAGILVLRGEPGTGKTFAAKTMCATLDVPVLLLHLAGQARGNDVLRDLLERLDLPTSGSKRELIERAHHALDGRRLVLLVDEAHQLNKDALLHLQYLGDQPGMRFALVMTGTTFERAFRSVPELQSRVTRQVLFERIDDKSLVKTLGAHHPVLAATEPKHLRWLDRQYGKGNLRAWDNILRTAVGYGASEVDGITEPVARRVVRAIKGEIKEDR